MRHEIIIKTIIKQKHQHNDNWSCVRLTHVEETDLQDPEFSYSSFVWSSSTIKRFKSTIIKITANSFIHHSLQWQMRLHNYYCVVLNKVLIIPSLWVTQHRLFYSAVSLSILFATDKD